MLPLAATLLTTCNYDDYAMAMFMLTSHCQIPMTVEPWHGERIVQLIASAQSNKQTNGQTDNSICWQLAIDVVVSDFCCNCNFNDNTSSLHTIISQCCGCCCCCCRCY